MSARRQARAGILPAGESSTVPPELLDVEDPTWLTAKTAVEFHRRNGLEGPLYTADWPGGRYRRAVHEFARANGLMNPQYQNVPDWKRIYKLGIDCKPVPMQLRRLFRG